MLQEKLVCTSTANISSKSAQGFEGQKAMGLRHREDDAEEASNVAALLVAVASTEFSFQKNQFLHAQEACRRFTRL